MASERFSIAHSSRSSSTPLQRGRACGNCRRRKIRCDGNKPVCDPCRRSTRPGDPCEYTDASLSRTQVLEANIARLEARVHELENPDQSIALSRPYDESHESRRLSSSSLRAQSSQGSPNQFSPVSASYPESPKSTTPSSISSNFMHEQQDEPPLMVIKLLLQNVLPHFSEFGFFLNVTRFCSTAILPLPIGHHARPSPALLSAVYLWGVHLSQTEAFTTHEHVFITRAVQHMANSLSSSHPHKIIHGIQAEVLLASYFFRAGRFLEGQYHVNGAISLSISSGLHKIRSIQGSLPLVHLLGSTETVLRPPIDTVEEGERTRAFWTVYAMSLNWGVALSSPPNVAFDVPGMQVDTPWPLDTEQYEHNQLPVELRGNFTVRNFLENFPDVRAFGEFSTLSMYAKASILFERAARQAAQYYPNMQPDEANQFWAAFTSLSDLIDRFIVGLPSITQLEMSIPTIVRTVLVTHTLAHAASIQLHTTLIERHVPSREKCLSSALAIVKMMGDVNPQNLLFLNPIIGSLWIFAHQSITDELSRLRNLHSVWAPDVSFRKEDLVAALDRGFAAMTMFASTVPLTDYSLQKLQASYPPA